MVFNVNTTTVGASAAAETGISAEVGGAAAAAAAPLLTVMPMGADLDSIEFAAALNAAGAAYIASAGEHMANRGMFAGTQTLSAATSAVTEAIRDTELTI